MRHVLMMIAAIAVPGCQPLAGVQPRPIVAAPQPAVPYIAPHDREASASPAAAERLSHARAAEARLLRQGIDAQVRVGGPGNTELYMDSVYFSRPTVFQLENDTAFMADAAKRGFTMISISSPISLWRWRLVNGKFVPGG